MSQETPKALWGGRFSESTDAFVQAFTASVGFDQRMAREDIEGSIAHASMLAEQGILTSYDCQTIIEGLIQIESEIQAGNFSWSIAREDVHMNIESRLIDLVGDTGKKLHTGRSRNDQVATDIRLWLRGTIGFKSSLRFNQGWNLYFAKRNLSRNWLQRLAGVFVYIKLRSN